MPQRGAHPPGHRSRIAAWEKSGRQPDAPSWGLGATPSRAVSEPCGLCECWGREWGSCWCLRGWWAQNMNNSIVKGLPELISPKPTIACVSVGLVHVCTCDRCLPECLCIPASMCLFVCSSCLPVCLYACTCVCKHTSSCLNVCVSWPKSSQSP